MNNFSSNRPDVNDFILRGLTQSGDEFFYTGRTGDGWLCADFNEAFAYSTINEARRKATILNRGTWAHGVRFVAVPVSGPADANPVVKAWPF